MTLTLNDYIEKFKSMDMTGMTPIEAYKELLFRISQYYQDTGDDYLGNCYCEVNNELVQEDVKTILLHSGWKAAWRYLHTLPEEAINDDYYGLTAGQLRPINWTDVAELQGAMVAALQEKQPQSSKNEKLTEALHSLTDAVRTIESLVTSEEKK